MRQKNRDSKYFTMKQQSFTDIEYSGRRRVSKREQFLDIMEEIVPWEEWVNLVEPLLVVVFSLKLQIKTTGCAGGSDS